MFYQQNYLVFLPAIKHIKYFHGTTQIFCLFHPGVWCHKNPACLFNEITQIYLWKSYRISKKSIENITKSDNNFAPTFVDHHSLPDINFNELGLIKNNVSIPNEE